MSPITEDHRQVAKVLGYLGTLPVAFCCVAVADRYTMELLVHYSTAIAAFLCGNAWSTALLSRATAPAARRSLLVFSNLIVLVAVGLSMMPPTPAIFFAMAIVFAVLLLFDLTHSAFYAQPPYYRRMRIRVSIIVVALHFLVAVRTSVWPLEHVG